MDQNRRTQSADPKKKNQKKSLGIEVRKYMSQAGLTKSRLAIRSELEPSYIWQLVNDRIQSPSVGKLVKLCLALQLSKRESKRLLSIANRSFSPIKPQEKVYQKIIEMYYNSGTRATVHDEMWLEEAYDELQKYGLEDFS